MSYSKSESGRKTSAFRSNLMIVTLLGFQGLVMVVSSRIKYYVVHE